MDASHLFNPDGTLKQTFRQRQAARKEAEQKTFNIQLKIQAASVQPETNSERLARVSAQQIEDIQTRLRGSLAPDERSMLKARLNVLKAGNKQAAEQVASESRQAEFAADQRVSYCRQIADFLRKDGAGMYPNVKPEELQLAIAIADSNDWTTPDDMYREFRAVEERIALTEAEAQRKIAADAEHESLRVQSEHAAAELKAAEARLRLEQTRNAE